MRLLPFLMMPFLFITIFPSDLVADPWSDQAELSFVDTGGNTRTTSMSAKNILKGPLSERLSLTWSISGLFSETDSVTTAEQYMTDVKLDYSLSDRSYLFALGNWKQDEPAGLDSRTSLGLGAGYRFLTGPTHDLSGEAGINTVSEEFTDGTDNRFTGGRLFGAYGWNFSDSSRFTQTLEYLTELGESDNYQINTETAFISTVSETLSLKMSYDVQFDNDPPPAFEKTDTKLNVTLVLNIH